MRLKRNKRIKRVMPAQNGALSAYSALAASQRRLPPGHVEMRQPGLLGFGPEIGDGFRFTWWNTAIGAAVWVADRGGWRAGVIAGRGRKYVRVAIVGRRGARRYVRKPYSELRRRR